MTGPSPALLIDLYELTMAQAYLRDGHDRAEASFSLFVRGPLPPSRGYLVAAGLDDALSWLESLRFTEADLVVLDGLGVLDRSFIDHLGSLRFTGSVRAVPEGRIVTADEPLLEVDAPLLEAQLAESYLLNQITLQTGLATKAARCVAAAGGRPVVDFAMRRTPGVDAAMKLARVGAIAGVAATSNVAGHAAYGVAAQGTMAHSLVQAYGEELAAFRSFAQVAGASAVLLVDTYDTIRGVERAITVAREMRERGQELRGIRLDSGELGSLSVTARSMLDDAGFGEVSIFASGGLDEHAIAELVKAAPIDGFGVGSALGAPSDAPVLETVYKLVEVDGRPTLKTSSGKATWPARKQVWRAPEGNRDLLAAIEEESPGPGWEPLLVEVMTAGKRTEAGRTTAVDLDAAHQRLVHDRSRIAPDCAALRAPVAHPLEVTDRLLHMAAAVRESTRP